MLWCHSMGVGTCLQMCNYNFKYNSRNGVCLRVIFRHQLVFVPFRPVLTPPPSPFPSPERNASNGYPQIPDEPSYVILNTAVSSSWGFPIPPPPVSWSRRGRCTYKLIACRIQTDVDHVSQECRGWRGAICRVLYFLARLFSRG